MSIQMAHSLVTVCGDMLGLAVSKMSTNVLQTLAKMMALVWTGSEIIPASACLVYFYANLSKKQT